MKQPRRGVICNKCGGPIERTRPNSVRCRACNNGKTPPTMSMKPMKKCWIVKKGPGSNGRVSTADNVPYYSEKKAVEAAASLASRERCLFIVFEAVAQFDVAPAIRIPFEEEPHPLPIDCDIDDCDICKKESWHDEDTTCDIHACPVCNNCSDGSCANCYACGVIQPR